MCVVCVAKSSPISLRGGRRFTRIYPDLLGIYNRTCVRDLLYALVSLCIAGVELGELRRGVSGHHCLGARHRHSYREDAFDRSDEDLWWGVWRSPFSSKILLQTPFARVGLFWTISTRRWFANNLSSKWRRVEWPRRASSSFRSWKIWFNPFYYVLLCLESDSQLYCVAATLYTELTTNTTQHNHWPRVFVFVWKWKTLQLHNFPLPKMQCVLRFHSNVSF